MVLMFVIWRSLEENSRGWTRPQGSDYMEVHISIVLRCGKKHPHQASQLSVQQ